MKVVTGALANVEVDEDLRDMAKDLRYVATLIERGEVNGVALVWTGDSMAGEDGKVSKDGVGLSWTCVNGNVYTLAGGIGQIQHQIQMETSMVLMEEDE